ncbi:MAG: F0F1 ATP synthase subunit gamma [Dysgonamonadaceae bacterium]|jgi:F-type H+-transporting ATPase subunit gamma|nr:F0F1 ATP synthase subunit gamma [Dysgonamonadaceae bacterium]
MSSLKEIKGRIASVKSTQKITSAMKMVASANLRKAQSRIEGFLPYQQKLDEMFQAFVSSVTDFESNLKEEREIRRVAIVVFSSNSGLCGAFNSNILKLLKETLLKYKHLPHEAIEIYPVGKKIEDQVRRMNLPYKIMGSYIEWMDKPDFTGAKTIANELINNFLNKKIDKVDLLYNHFKSAGVQVPTAGQYLPVILQPADTNNSISIDYIVEPDKATILHSLLPKSLHSKIYAVALDSAAAEQAARVVAMQIATDNAGDLLDGLTIQYNKQRQQVITSELLDIIGGSEALK